MNRTLLFVEDDTAVRTALSGYLQNCGFDVLTASGLGAAIAILDNLADRISVILSDVKMPDGSGVDLLDHVQNKELPVPVVLLTAHANLDLALQGIRKRAYDLIEKPPDFELLRQGMEKACRFSSLLRLEKRYTLELKEEIDRKTEELKEERQRLAELAVELSRVEEHERRRIASELHDNIGQTLIFSNMKLLELKDYTLPAACREELNEAINSIGFAVSEIRNLTIQISPPLLYDVGLVPALDSLAESFSSRYGLRISLAPAEEPPGLAEESRSMLYQAARELLINVVKHSGATRADITVACNQGNLVITVKDNGKGIADKTLQSDGFGLFNIRQRLQWVGGRILLETNETNGAKVSLIFPLDPANPDQRK